MKSRSPYVTACSEIKIMSRLNIGRFGIKAASQRGAVLYVALIMLVLLALIGIIGMQVAGIQERMAASYRAVNLAFQHGEQFARDTECGLELLNGVPDVAGTDCTLVPRTEIHTNCADGYDPGAWAAAQTLAGGAVRNVRQIETCIIGEAEIAMGLTQEQGGGLQPVYRITIYETDAHAGSSPTSATAIDTIFKL